MYKIIAFLTAVVLLTATACRSSKPVATSTVITDSTTVERTTSERDTTITASADTANVTIPLEQLKDSFKAEVKGKQQARAKVTVKANKLHVECQCDTMAINAKLRDTYEQILRNTHRTDTVIVPVKFIPKWVKILAWIGGLWIAAFVIFICLKLSKIL